MRAIDPALQAQALGVVGQGFDMARQRVVGFVAVHVHAQAACGGKLHQQPHALRAVGHGALKVRNAAHHIHPQVERAHQLRHGARAAQHAVLRKGHQLQVEVGRHPAFDFQQGFYRQQARVADVNVAADRQQPFGHGPVAIGQRPLDQRVLRQQRLELAPQRNAFEQRARLVDTGQAIAQRGVHVKVGIDKGRAQQQALRVQRLGRRRLQARGDFDDAAVLHGDRHVGAAIGQRDVVNQQV